MAMFFSLFLIFAVAANCERSFSSVRSVDIKTIPKINLQIRSRDEFNFAVKYRVDAALHCSQGCLVELWVDREWYQDTEGEKGIFEVNVERRKKRHEVVVCLREAEEGPILALGKIYSDQSSNAESPKQAGEERYEYTHPYSLLRFDGKSIVTDALGFTHSTTTIQVLTYPNMTRDDIPKMLEALGFTGPGAEVGVWQGENAYRILSGWPRCSRFFLVDLYLNDEMGLEPGDPRWITQEQMDQVMNDAQNRLEPFADKIEFIRENSMAAAMFVEPESLDYVYVDTSVGRDNVLHDLLAWYPAVRPGGVLAGHDYYNAAGATGGVLEFLALKVGEDTQLHVTGERVGSFFFFKPKCTKVQYPLSEIGGKLSDAEKKLVQLLDAERSFDARVEICNGK